MLVTRIQHINYLLLELSSRDFSWTGKSKPAIVQVGSLGKRQILPGESVTLMWSYLLILVILGAVVVWIVDSQCRWMVKRLEQRLDELEGQLQDLQGRIEELESQGPSLWDEFLDEEIAKGNPAAIEAWAAELEEE